MKNKQIYPTTEMKELFAAILQLKNTTEATHFFRDLLTLPELNEFTNRWQIVKLLMKNSSYLEIARKLNVSTTTVTRVAQWLNHGLGGYKLVAARVSKQKSS